MFESLFVFNGKIVAKIIILVVVAIGVLVIFLAKCLPLWNFNELTFPPKKKEAA